VFPDPASIPPTDAAGSRPPFEKPFGSPLAQTDQVVLAAVDVGVTVALES
jgi:hypothetical protein